MEKEYLTEKRYQNVKKGLIYVAITIFAVITTLSTIFLIIPGIQKLKEANDFVIPTEESVKAEKDVIEGKYDILETQLEAKYELLEDELAAKYTKEMGDEGWFEERQEYGEESSKLSIAEGKEKISLMDDKSDELFAVKSVSSFEFEQRSIRNNAIPLIAGGIFALFFALMISGGLLASAFGRHILAFNAQSVMPVAQEGIEKMAPTIGKAAGTIATAAAPAYGEVAKEIAKGIKEGLKDEEK